MSNRKPRVLLADDHPAIIQAVSQLLSHDLEIVGAVGDGASLLAAAKRLEPAVIVMDITMPIMNGFQAAREIREIEIKSKIVFLSVHDDRDYQNGAFEAGARGYVLKSHINTDLVFTLWEVLAGRTFASLGGFARTASPVRSTLAEGESSNDGCQNWPSLQSR